MIKKKLEAGKQHSFLLTTLLRMNNHEMIFTVIQEDQRIHYMQRFKRKHAYV